MHRTSALALTLSLTLAACGGGASSDPGGDGFKALNSGDHAKAVEHFDAALAQAAAGSKEHHDLAIARCEALAHVDVSKVEAALAKIQGLKVKDYAQVANSLLSAKAFDQAVRVMDMGHKAFPDDAEMGKLKDKIVAAVQSSGDEAGASALQGLGYLGGGGD